MTKSIFPKVKGLKQVTIDVYFDRAYLILELIFKIGFQTYFMPPYPAILSRLIKMCLIKQAGVVLVLTFKMFS